MPIAIVIALIAVVAIPGGHVLRNPYPYPEWIFTYGLSALDIVGALLVLTAIQPDAMLSRALSWRPLCWLGRISYGACVLHDIPHPVFNWVGAHISQRNSMYISATMAFVFTLVAAWVISFLRELVSGV